MPMQYVSTRDGRERQSFATILTRSLAANGGLYLPQSWPVIDAATRAAWRTMPYHAVASDLLARFVGDAFSTKTLADMCEGCYAAFRHRDVAPLIPLDKQTWLLDLTQGPTLAFKDYPLQLIGRMTTHALAGKPATILTATSGDTGAAAVAAFAHKSNIKVFVLFPKGRIAEIQRRQMTTTGADNVRVIAIDGTFDDCQALVKQLFADPDMGATTTATTTTATTNRLGRLMAVNSINFARIAAQIVYYYTAAAALPCSQPPTFVVPTGNFGNVFAAYAARRMGLPVQNLVIANNRNDVVTRFLQTGSLTAGRVVATTSPAMDIQVPSNFERFLYELFDRDTPALQAFLASPNAAAHIGGQQVSPAQLARAQENFAGTSADDAAVHEAIADTYKRTGIIVDPHTATGLVAARDVPGPRIVLSTAHPAKFPDTVAAATGQTPTLPTGVANPYTAREEFLSLPPDMQAIKSYLLL